MVVGFCPLLWLWFWFGWRPVRFGGISTIFYGCYLLWVMRLRFLTMAYYPAFILFKSNPLLSRKSQPAETIFLFIPLINKSNWVSLNSIFYTRSSDFPGGNILEPKQCLVAGEISSRRENCWQRSPPATRCRCGKQLSLPQKSEDVAVCGGGDTRDRLVLASNFFPDTKMTL